MYKSKNSYKYKYKQLLNTPRPAFIQRINHQTIPGSSLPLQKYVISMDGEKFFLVSSYSAQSAVKISMDIGVNPDPPTNPPPSPGKPKTKPKKRSNTSQKTYRKRRTQKGTIKPISKEYAIRLVNKQINNCSPYSSKWR